MNGAVVVVREPGRTDLHIIVRDVLEVGRRCSGLLLDDPQVSRRHAELRLTDGRLTVSDLGSANGTFVAGQRVEGPTTVEEGSIVRIGDTTIELLSSAQSSGPVEASRPRTDQTSIERVAAAAESEGLDLDPQSGAGTHTIVFSDIENSTARAVELGDARWFEILSAHNRIIRHEVANHRGREIKSQGDGFMLAFDSARRAVLCMIDVQRRLAAHGTVDPSLAVRIRVGAHTGEAVERDDGDLFGRAVVVAARVADKAVGGEILVSSLVREMVEPWGDVVFGESRRVELKGLTGQYTVHQVLWQDSGPASDQPGSASTE